MSTSYLAHAVAGLVGTVLMLVAWGAVAFVGVTAKGERARAARGLFGIAAAIGIFVAIFKVGAPALAGFVARDVESMSNLIVGISSTATVLEAIALAFIVAGIARLAAERA
jgi:hypothetical protein